MQAVILAGGLGSRLSEETHSRPKPMVEIGGRPILWHIMKLYSTQGVNDFVICLGYKGYMIKEYFFNYAYHNANLEIDIGASAVTMLDSNLNEQWKVRLIDTGDESQTGGRLRRVLPYIDTDTFHFTYGDGVADIDIKALESFHQEHSGNCTISAVQPPGRFGVLEISESGTVDSFREKPADEVGWINGGFFILSKDVAPYLTGDDCVWEKEPLQRLASDQSLHAYRHHGFWQPMDTLRDKHYLESLWSSGKAPWAIWGAQ